MSPWTTRSSAAPAAPRTSWPGAEVVIYRDDDTSGYDPKADRPGFRDWCRAVRTCPTGTLVGVITNEQSRLTRQGKTGGRRS